MAANGTHKGNGLEEFSAPKLFPNGETNQLVLYLVGTKPSGISNFFDLKLKLYIYRLNKIN